jgi:hypothetical protein
VRPAEETAEVAALDDTALQIPVAKPQAEPPLPPATPGHRGIGGLLRAGLLVALAASGAFALWMATPPGRQSSRAPQVLQPRR